MLNICLKSLSSRPSSLLLSSNFRKHALSTQVEDIYDIVIVGGGMVGAAVGALLGRNSFTSKLRVAILDQQALNLDIKPPEYPELRVSTIIPSSLVTLSKAGVWPDVEIYSAPFSKMQVWDASGEGCICWDARELEQKQQQQHPTFSSPALKPPKAHMVAGGNGEPLMGCVVENTVLQASLLAATQSSTDSCVSLLPLVTVKALGLPKQQPKRAGDIGGEMTSSTSSSAPFSAPRAHNTHVRSSQMAQPEPTASEQPSKLITTSTTSQPGSTPAGTCTSTAANEVPMQQQSHVLPGSENGLAWLQLQDGRVLRARLVVAADGASSRVRALAGLRTSGYEYGQRGVVATVMTDDTEDRTAWQRFLPAGPLALLPVRGGLHNIVWSTTPEAARKLERLSPQDFAEAVNRALQDSLPVDQAMRGLVGEVSRQVASLLSSITPKSKKVKSPPHIQSWVGSQPRSFPLQMQHAGRYVLPRLALVGDAAHAVHPLAGQGVNLGIADAEALVQAVAMAVECGADVGDPLILRDQYENKRMAANSAMMTGKVEETLSLSSPNSRRR
ncbi:hypothetical protein CEUSTIGMA_g5503.t1 [Chlamydomonas eustigma]|uniref:FAD-binding domain-containing protein n=1 Tax=Chlamydomonas eustigma TaxID=1157962 RepID=A0A250X4S2_9CHLO|nr:hypothetical protein CEUSTIGMA_g5503.t1 [Chlamydomonas eustigma]|eukprot:GAX78061.1 hypothetical protein CEUSTIGMA_g5503.t1 [Chlamydomonas eustigma]